MPFQIKRGTNSQRLGYTPLAGELVYTTDTNLLYIGDGTTPGGIPAGLTGPAGPTGAAGISGSVVSINGLTGVVTGAVFQYGTTLYTYQATTGACGLGYFQTTYGPQGIICTIVQDNGSTTNTGYQISPTGLAFNNNPAEIQSIQTLSNVANSFLVYSNASDSGKTSFSVANNNDPGYTRITDTRGGTFESFLQINRGNLAASGQSVLQINAPLGKNIRIFNNSRITNLRYVDIDASSTGDLNVFPVGGTAMFASNIIATGYIRTTDKLEGNTLSIFSSFTPAGSTAPGNTGTIAWDSDYLYVCVSQDSWKRAGLTSW